MPDLSFLGSGIGAAVGTLGNIATTVLNNKYQKEQWNREVAHEQATYERNRADYLADLDNERQYNSPSAQMDRLHEAGLNPNLMSEGALTTGNSSTASPMPMGNNVGMAPVQSADFTSGLVAATDSAVQMLESRSRISKNLADANLQGELALSEKEFRPVKKALIRAQVAKENGQTKVYIEQAKKAAYEAITAKIRSENEQEVINRTLSKLQAETHEVYSRSSRNTAEAGLALAKQVSEGLAQDYIKAQTKTENLHRWSVFAKDICISLSAVGITLSNIIGSLKSFKSLIPEKGRGSYDDFIKGLERANAEMAEKHAANDMYLP